MKYLILFVFLLATSAHAQTRCRADVDNSVSAQAQIDFPGAEIVVSMPDMNNESTVTVDNYLVDVISARSPSLVLGRYNVMVGETCHVISGPTLVK